MKTKIRSSSSHRFGRPFAALLLALVGSMATGVQADTIFVTSTESTGAGTLREALASAADGDIIDATGISGTITLLPDFLTSSQLGVTASVTILGPGPANLTVDGNGTSRVFRIFPGRTVTIEGLTIANGRASGAPPGSFPPSSGGGIYNDHSALTVNNCVLSGNSADEDGGGINNDGSISGSATLTVSNCTFSGNSADRGGGINNDGSTSGNATLTVIASTFSGNSADGGGGGIYSDALGGSAALTVANSILNDNSSGQGGAILNARSTLEVSTCTFSGNSAVLRGGGMLTASGSQSMRVTHSTFSGNSANGAVAGFGSEGGGICNAGSTLEVSTSTISGNSASRGGGIFNGGDGGTLLVANTTLSGNSASLGGGILNFTETGSTPIVHIGNSILKTGSLGASIDANGPGGVISRGFNLSSDDGGGFLTATGDQINTDPKLGPLADNGGLTRTHLLLAGSPALDGGLADTIPALATGTDQRGFARTVDDFNIANAFLGDGTDIGAVELAAPNNAPVAKCKNVTVLAGPDGMANASIDDGSSDSDSGGAITLVQNPPGPYPTGTTSVTLTVTDSAGASSSCTATVTVQGVADLAISKAVVSGQAKPGQLLIYTIIVTNLGPNPATVVVINDAVPQGTTFVSASPSPASAPPVGAGGTVVWNAGTLASGASATFTLKVKVSVKGNNLIVNTANLTSSSSDPNLANNTATVTSRRQTK